MHGYFLLVLFVFLQLSAAAEFKQGDKSATMQWYAMPAPHPTDDLGDGMLLSFNIPLSESLPHRFSWQNAHKYSQRFAASNDQTREFSTLNLGVRVPITHSGALHLGWSPILLLSGQNQWQNAHLQQADTNSQKSVLTHDAWLSSSTAIDFSWEAFSLSYQIKSGATNHFEVGLLKHIIAFQGSTASRGDWVLQHQHYQAADQSVETFDSQWEGGSFYSQVRGEYTGSAWSAFVELKWSFFTWRTIMATPVTLKGNYQLQQVLPYFIDQFTFLPQVSWNTAAQRDSLLQGYTQNTTLSSDAALTFKIPNIHHFSVQINSWVRADYTYFNRAITTVVPGDSTLANLDLRTYVTIPLRPNHITLLHLYTPYGGAGGGFMLDGSKFIPLVNVFARWPFHDFAIFGKGDLWPLARLTVGLNYAF